MAQIEASKVLRSWGFSSMIDRVNLFHSRLLQLLTHGSNAAVPMLWDAEMQNRFSEPGRPYTFTDCDDLCTATWKLLLGFRTVYDEDVESYQPELLSWLSVLYRHNVQVGSRLIANALSLSEVMVTSACTRVSLGSRGYLNSRHMWSCWMHVCRYYGQHPDSDFYYPVDFPAYVIKDGEFFAAAMGRGLGPISRQSVDINTSTVEDKIFKSAQAPALVQRPVEFKVEANTADPFSLAVVDHYTQDFTRLVQERLLELPPKALAPLSENNDQQGPRAGRRKHPLSRAVDEPLRPMKRAREELCKVHLLWRPPALGEKDLSTLQFDRSKESFAILTFLDQYSRCFQSVLMQHVLVTNGMFWTSYNESVCRAVDEKSTLFEIGVSVCLSGAALPSVCFFFGVFLEVIQLCFHPSRITGLYWSYVADVLRAYHDSHAGRTLSSLCVALWRIAMAAFAAWMGTHMEFEVVRRCVARFFLSSLRNCHTLRSYADKDAPSEINVILALMFSASNRSETEDVFGARLYQRVFQRFSIPLDPPVCVPLSLLTPSLSFASFLEGQMRSTAEFEQAERQRLGQEEAETRIVFSDDQ